MKKTVTLTIVFFALLLLSCTAVRNVKPLNKGDSRISLSFGGPITEVAGTNIPLPLLNVGYSYGVYDDVSIESGMALTDLLFGVMHIDGGITFHPLTIEKWNAGAYVSPGFVLTTNFKEDSFRLLPALNLGWYWEHKKSFFYTGVDSWFEFRNKRTDQNPQKNRWLPALYLGYGLNHNTWCFQVEGRLFTPHLKNSGRPVNNQGIGQHGIWGIYIGVNRSFGGRK
ncbi:hypothetical protein QA601_02730 [Chitinispirillales bacterium ANBcel5]|uniref:hypothetical protein n=1 Tax=Cellulosispirillum alkaliphilum TaxID=3039283 RepID=UPI002A517A4B|nr:hypothetical protein [Chitinispirillales bacterium ANBcel5]